MNMDDRQKTKDKILGRLKGLVKQSILLKSIGSNDKEELEDALLTLNARLLSMVIETIEAYNKYPDLLKELKSKGDGINLDRTFKITLQCALDDNLENNIKQLQKEYRGSFEGIYDLYDILYNQGEIKTHNRTMAHYIAYSLSERNINFTMDEQVHGQ